MIDLLSQAWITVFGATAIWLMNGRHDRWRRWGVVCGISSQPAWYCQLVLHDQWLMLPVYTIYTIAWLRGVWNLWLRPESRPSFIRPIHAVPAPPTRPEGAA